ncbi:MAG TPA: Hint domain-containing protein [Pseudolabrys sp.]|nr:Hint domain-containing protein [Pseudolabrys sp.]HVO33541.1 Hint domain-containing protein [Elusimicrobiota bacterium]
MTIPDNSTNNAPVISGAGQWLNNGYFTLPLDPFSGVTISDPDSGATETVTISLTNFGSTTPTDGNGTLTLPDTVQGVSLVETAPGVYTLSAASPDVITQALDAIEFTPIPNPSQPGFTITDFDLSVSDGLATTTAENFVLAGAPVITGAVAGQMSLEDQPVNPFSAVTVTDSPDTTNMSVIIQLRDSGTSPAGPTTDANGTLALPDALQGDVFFGEFGAGNYLLIGDSPAQITAALDAMVFTPTLTPQGQTVTTDFTLTVSDNASTSNDYITSVTATDPNCFCQGTLILTERGEVPVEDLVVDDKVVTLSGAISPITWIGRRKVAARFSDPVRVWPVRIASHALAENVPSRDLRLSPDHAVLLDGILVQAGALVNGTSIVRETTVPDTFVYYHIELDNHELILANNVPAETFIDNIGRRGFDNWTEYEALHPQGSAIGEMSCPRAKAYRQVPRAIHARLAARAAAIIGAYQEKAA